MDIRVDVDRYKKLIITNIGPLWKYRAVRIVTYITASYIGVSTFRRILHYIRQKWYNLPPGPVGSMFIGSFLGMVEFRKFLPSLASKYGPISMINIGVTNFVIIHDQQLLRESFKLPQFLKVRPMANMSVPNLGDLNGAEWRKRRQLLSTSFIGNKELQSVRINDFILNECLKPYIFKNMDRNSGHGQLYMVRNDAQFISFHTVHRVIFMNDNITLAPNDDIYIKAKALSYQLHNLVPMCTLIRWLFGYDSSIGMSLCDSAAPCEKIAVELDDIIINKWIQGQEVNPNGYLATLLKRENHLNKIQISREIQVYLPCHSFFQILVIGFVTYLQR